MKIFLSIAAALAAITLAPAAFADGVQPSKTGHSEWRTPPTFGPRAPLRAAVLVWVKDDETVPDCDCAMMHQVATAGDCMAMPQKGTGTSHG